MLNNLIWLMVVSKFILVLYWKKKRKWHHYVTFTGRREFCMICSIYFLCSSLKWLQDVGHSCQKDIKAVLPCGWMQMHTVWKK